MESVSYFQKLIKFLNSPPEKNSRGTILINERFVALKYFFIVGGEICQRHYKKRKRRSKVSKVGVSHLRTSVHFKDSESFTKEEVGWNAYKEYKYGNNFEKDSIYFPFDFSLSPVEMKEKLFEILKIAEHGEADRRYLALNFLSNVCMIKKIHSLICELNGHKVIERMVNDYEKNSDCVIMYTIHFFMNFTFFEEGAKLVWESDSILTRLLEFMTSDLSGIGNFKKQKSSSSKKIERKNHDYLSPRVLKECFFFSSKALVHTFQHVKGSSFKLKHLLKLHNSLLQSKTNTNDHNSNKKFLKRFFRDTLYYVLYDHQTDWECLTIFTTVVNGTFTLVSDVVKSLLNPQYIKSLQYAILHLKRCYFSRLEKTVKRKVILNSLSFSIMQGLFRNCALYMIGTEGNPTLFQRYAPKVVDMVLDLLVMAVHPQNQRRENDALAVFLLPELLCFFEFFTHRSQDLEHVETISSFYFNPKTHKIISFLFDEGNPLFIGGRSFRIEEKLKILGFLNRVGKISRIEKDLITRYKPNLLKLIRYVFNSGMRMISSSYFSNSDSLDLKKNESFGVSEMVLLERTISLVIFHREYFGNDLVEDFFPLPPTLTNLGFLLTLLGLYESFERCSVKNSSLFLINSMICIAGGKRAYDYLNDENLKRRNDAGKSLLEILYMKYGDVEELNKNSDISMKLETRNLVLSRMKFAEILDCLREKRFDEVKKTPIIILQTNKKEKDGWFWKDCRYCQKENAKKKCGGCKGVYYCGAKCQRADWKLHKKVCRKMY